MEVKPTCQLHFLLSSSSLSPPLMTPTLDGCAPAAPSSSGKLRHIRPLWFSAHIKETIKAMTSVGSNGYEARTSGCPMVQKFANYWSNNFFNSRGYLFIHLSLTYLELLESTNVHCSSRAYLRATKVLK